MSFTIYFRPEDVPGALYVVRGWQIGPGQVTPTGWMQLASTLEEARALVPPTSDACLVRNDGDDPSIVETWM